MNKIEAKVLKELEKDPKITTTALAKKIKTSQQRANYNINKLIKNKTISSLGTVINLPKLGLEQYRVFISVIDPKNKEQILDYLKTQTNVYWAAIIGGKFDITVTFFVKNYAELEQSLDKLMKISKITDYQAYYILTHHIFGHKYISNEPKHYVIDSSTDVKKLDKVDLEILKIISANCRTPMIEIGRKLNISYKTVIYRINKMIKSDVILGNRIYLKSDHSAYMLLANYSNYSKEYEKKLIGFSSAHKKITHFIRMFGKQEVLFHLRCESLEEVQDMLIEIKNKFPFLSEFEIIPVFKNISINLFPGDR